MSANVFLYILGVGQDSYFKEEMRMLCTSQ